MKEPRKQNAAMIKRILKYGLLSLGIAAALSMLSAALILNGTLPTTTEGILPPIIAAVSVLCGGKIACGGSENERLPVGVGVGAVFFLMTLLGKILCFPGEGEGILRNAAICLAAGLVAALLSAGKGRARGRKRR